MSIPTLPDSIVSTLSQTRSVSVSISYKGQDISSQVADCLMDLVYRESFKENVQSDSLNVKLADPEGFFRKTFSLDAYAEVTCTISLLNWGGTGSGTSQKTLSTMYISSVRIESDKHAGTTVILKCVSIPPQSPFRLEKKSTGVAGAGQTTTLKDYAQQVATQDGLQLQYLPKTNPTIQRIDQHDHSDSYMLHKLCSEQDFSFVVKNGAIWIRDMADVEALSSLGTITCPTSLLLGGWQNGGLTRWEYVETVEDIYAAAAVNVTDPTTGNTVTGTAIDPNQPSTAPTLHHNRWLHDDGTAYDHITLF